MIQRIEVSIGYDLEDLGSIDYDLRIELSIDYDLEY